MSDAANYSDDSSERLSPPELFWLGVIPVLGALALVASIVLLIAR